MGDIVRPLEFPNSELFCADNKSYQKGEKGRIFCEGSIIVAFDTKNNGEDIMKTESLSSTLKQKNSNVKANKSQLRKCGGNGGGLYIIGILDPEPSGEAEGWIAILSSEELTPGFESKAKVELNELRRNQQFSDAPPIRFPQGQAFLYIGQYSICDSNGAPLENASSTNSHQNLFKLHQPNKWKYLLKCGLATFPFETLSRIVDNNTNGCDEGVVGVSEEKTVTCYLSLRKPTSSSSLSPSSSSSLSTSPVGGVFMGPRDQLKVAFGSALHSNFLQVAQSWFKKMFYNHNHVSLTPFGSASNNIMMNGRRSSPFLTKWVAINHNKRSKASSLPSLLLCGGTGGKKLLEHQENCYYLEDDNSSIKYNNFNCCSNKQQHKTRRYVSDEQIRIEIKSNGAVENNNVRDGGMRKKNGTGFGEDVQDLLEFQENDVIKIKITTFSLQDSCYQLEVDLVQRFVCETETDRFRRRIAKVLKRDVITEFQWEKGITASGKYFAVHWTDFQVPLITDCEVEPEKFRLSNFEYELRMRFFGDDDDCQTVASDCSFPISVVKVELKESSA